MKTVTTATDLEINANMPIHFINTFEDVYIDTETSIDGDELLNKINTQFDVLYKAQQTRRFLLNEISYYIVKK